MGFRDWISENIIDIGAAKSSAETSPAGGAVPGAPAARSAPGASRPGNPEEVPVHPTGKTVAQIAREVPRPQIDPQALGPAEKPTVSFDQVYRAAGVAAPAHGFDIFKVEHLLANERLKTLSAEAKSAAVLVALDAQGVKIEEVIRDAVTRDKALDAFEQFQLKKMVELQVRVETENKRLQDEIEQFIRQRHQATEANQKKLKAYQEEITAWRKQKGLEERRLYAVVAHFTSSNPITLTRTVASLPETDAEGEAAGATGAPGTRGAGGAGGPGAGGAGGSGAGGPTGGKGGRETERDPLEAACEGFPPVTDLSDLLDGPEEPAGSGGAGPGPART